MSSRLFIHKKRQFESEIHCQLEEPDDQLLDRKADNTVTSNRSATTHPRSKPRVKFTASQRLNTQLVPEDFVLKKKKGPNLRKVSFTLEI